MSTPTPRTDAEAWSGHCGDLDWQKVVGAHFARDLERENAKLRALLADCINAVGNGSAASHDASIDFFAWAPKEVKSYCHRLRAELEAARECIRRKDEVVLKMKGCAESAHRYRVYESYVSPGTVIRLCDAALALTPESVAAEGKI